MVYSCYAPFKSGKRGDPDFFRGVPDVGIKHVVSSTSDAITEVLAGDESGIGEENEENPMFPPKKDRAGKSFAFRKEVVVVLVVPLCQSFSLSRRKRVLKDLLKAFV